jgi:hypothetical protein
VAKAPLVTLADDGGNSIPTLRASAGAAAYGQTLWQEIGNPALSTSAATAANLFTVPAGQTFYLTDLYVGSNSSSPFLVQVQAAGTPIFYGYCKGDTGPLDLPGLETQPQAAAGQQVSIVLGQVAAATTAAYYLGGFSQ